MIPKECKRLAEVDFPVAEVSRHSAREKSIRHGHPSTLHLWWARRPLAACRAMLMALLLPDPCDAHCPKDFKTEARRLLKHMPGGAGFQPAVDSGKMPESHVDLALRKALLNFIADFANWDNSAKPAYLECARGLVKAAHSDASGKMPEPPLVVDPFAGGGSIPLEALRVGCDAFASDLNPVACLILKVLLEDIPRHGPALAEELRRVGKQIKEEAEKELAEFYPPDPDGARPIAYLWARTARCEAVGCGAEIPLMRSFWLCKKANRRRALRLKVVKPSGTGFQPVSSFQSVNPWKSPNLSIKGRNLPHLEAPAATYFVTFRCRKGLSLAENARDRVMSALRHWDGKRIDLDIAVIMPDHVHAIFRIVDGSTLSDILHSIKSFSANQINRLLGRESGLWLDESFDHIIRNGTEWEEKAEYIRQNPVKKGLVKKSEEYHWLYLGGQEDSHRLEACATPRVEFEIFEPKSEAEVRAGTVNRGNAVCPCCNTVLPVARVRAQLAEQRGGADVVFGGTGILPAGGGTGILPPSGGKGILPSNGGTGILPVRTGGARLLAVVTLDENKSGRHYRLPTERDYGAVFRAQKRLKKILDDWERSGCKVPCPVPDEPISLTEIRRVSVPIYGASTWGDLFTGRQKVMLRTYASLVSCARPSVLQRLSALALDRLLIVSSAHCRWKSSGESLIDMFGRHAIGMVWDFAESVPDPDDQGIFLGWVEQYSELLHLLGTTLPVQAQVGQGDAAKTPLPDESCRVWFTDPPYYDSIPYAHLADCFYVWLKRCVVGTADASLFSGELSSKDEECVVDRPHALSKSKKDEDYFEWKIGEVANDGRRILTNDGMGCVVFAHKTTEGWEALLGGIVQAGWSVSASWPITTELSTRLNARDTASLAASVHLACRPRPENAGVGGWEDILRELPNRIGDWMERLSGEGIRGADLVFSCIGPALELFSKYEKVETAEGREVKLPEFLEKVWEVVGRTALQQILGTAQASGRLEAHPTGMRATGKDASATLEEDARLTALFLWTLQSTNGDATGDKATSATEQAAGDEETEDDDGQTGKAKKGFTLIYDVARRFAQPLGIHLPNWEGRIIETSKGVVRLIPVLERREKLFGEKGAEAIARAIERSAGQDAQFTLFPDVERGTGFQPVKGRRGAMPPRPKNDTSTTARMAVSQATTLDRVHAAMLLQASGQATALRALLEAETQRSPDFLRLANALSALYPKDSEEKRLLDAMLLAVRS